MSEQTTLVDILREIGPNEAWFIKIDTKEIVNPYDYIKPYIPENYDELTDEEISKLNIPSKKDLNIYLLPSYEEINHHIVMHMFAEECVHDKKIRQALFYALRNHIYVEKFINVLKEYDLYEEYLFFSEGYYKSVIKEWMVKYNIEFN